GRVLAGAVPELSGQRQAQRVRASTRQVLLLARGAVRGAHRAGVELAAMPVVVAHLHRFIESAPLAPVERSGDTNGPVARLVAEDRAVVLLRGPHDLAGI